MKDHHAKKPSDPESAPAQERDAAMAKDPPPAFIIVLALWPRGDPNEAEWRWRVRSMQTGEERQFLRVADVLAFVASHTGAPIPR